MTKVQGKGEVIAIKALLESDQDFIRTSVKAAIEAALEAEMTEALGAAKGERSETRLGYRAGYYQRSLITRVGTLELRVPQDRAGRFSTELFERYQRSEKAFRFGLLGGSANGRIPLARRKSRNAAQNFVSRS